MKIYLDNAATTMLDKEVMEAMISSMHEEYGNPSSTHAYGRQAKASVEIARKKIADLMNCSPGEIYFTSGGTEANNTIIRGAITTYGINHVISSAIEHHAVGHVLDLLEKNKTITLSLVQFDKKGDVDYEHLERLLQNHPRAMVSLMHANNEIGNLTDVRRVADLCHQYDAYFHSDTIQSVAHYRYNLKDLNIHGMTAAAHKFHGPKGIGFMYINKKKKIAPYMYGGLQERGLRAGTENTLGIVGLAKAMEVAYRDIDQHTKHIKGIKEYMIKKIKASMPEATFNGNSADVENSLYTVLNVSLPECGDHKMTVFNLDLEGISVSGGSACSSGSVTDSHVISSLYTPAPREAVRFSFSKYTQYEEIDYTVEKLSTLCKEVESLSEEAQR